MVPEKIQPVRVRVDLRTNGNKGVLYISPEIRIEALTPDEVWYHTQDTRVWLGGGLFQRVQLIATVGNEIGDTSSNPRREYFRTTS